MCRRLLTVLTSQNGEHGAVMQRFGYLTADAAPVG